jgi:hypothetical protein
MTTIISEGECMRRAVTWISEQRTAHPEKKLAEIIDEASMRYNLSPKESESLIRILKKESASPCEP